jgi:hypothetical protein
LRHMPGWPIVVAMEQAPQTHRDIIGALGGPAILARELGIYRPIPTTVHWSTRGIPSRYWHRIVELLATKGHRFTAYDIERMPIKAAEAA